MGQADIYSEMRSPVDGGALTRRGMAATLAALLVSCAPKPPGQVRGTPLRIGFQRAGVMVLAKARGDFASSLARLVDSVEWVEFPSGPPLMEALGAGAINLGAVGETPPIFAQAAGAPIVYAAAQPITGAGSALMVPADSRIATVADLRGKKVAFTKATSSHLFIVEALRQAGLDLADIRPIYLKPSEAAGAFGSGTIDAWCAWDPYYALAQRNQHARVIISGETLPRTNAFLVAWRRVAWPRLGPPSCRRL